MDERITKLVNHVTINPNTSVPFFKGLLENEQDRGIPHMNVLRYLLVNDLLETGEYRVSKDEDRQVVFLTYCPDEKTRPPTQNVMELLKEGNYLIERSGQKFVKYAGLLHIATKYSRVDSIESQLVESLSSDDRYVFKATISGSRGTFTDYGDADVTNVGRLVQTAMLRMASTRAIVRALRLYLGVGLCGLEEINTEEKEKKLPQTEI